MDITTIIGIIVAAIGLLGGMYFKGVPFSNLANPAALFIIFVGTTGAVINATPKKDLVKIGALFKLALFGRKQDDNLLLVKQFVDYAQIAREEGLLSLEGTINGIADPFIKRSMGLLMTGQDVEFVKSFLKKVTEPLSKKGVLLKSEALNFIETSL